jgi:hypothetical protein
MNFSLTEDQRILRDEIRKFARAELNGDVSERDREQTFAPELWRKCAEMGLHGLCVPEEYGGGGLDPLTTAIALEALGYGCEDSGLVFSVCAQLLSCVVPLVKFGSAEQKQRYLPRLVDGSLIVANAMTEPDSGSDAFALRTRAVPDGDGFKLDGTKMFITNGPVAGLALVFAMTDPDKGYHGGITAFLVDSDTPGYTAKQTFEKMGLRTSPIGELVFEDMHVPASAVLGGVGGGSSLFVHSMDWERTCLFASHVGTLERLLEKAVQYSRGRKQYGRTISKFQGVSHKIADMKIALEAARWLVYRAAWQLERSKAVSLDASIAKVFVSDSLVKTALDTIQVFGGYGFMTDYQVERALRDAVGARLYSGTNEVQRNIIAGWLGL